MIGSRSRMLVKVGVMFGGHGQDRMMMMVGLWWKRDGGEGRSEREGHSISYCLSLSR